MQQLRIGSTVDLGIGKAKVLGVIKFHTYTEYLVKMDLLGQGLKHFWLEEGREWRLWRKIKPPFKSTALLPVLKESWDKRYLLGEGRAGLNWLIIREIGFAQVLEAEGETEDTDVGEKVVYVEGCFQERQNWEFNLFVAEIWNGNGNGELECYEGRMVNI
ncbi:MAG: hypothetical protein PHE52_02070 [Candidatus Pacebacteria bacterium]|nr:hypothetical protein [Candidatus Paceibacterota bacterium]